KLIQDYNLEEYTLVAMGKMNQKDGLVKNNRLLQGTNSNVMAVVRNENGNNEKANVTPAVSVETSYPSGEFKINETRVIFTRKGTSYLDIAQRFEIPLSKLFEFNDLKPEEVTATDQLVFVQRKRKVGNHEFHVVQR